MMPTKFILPLIFLFISCGRNVATPGNLESTSNITSGDTQNLTSSGKLLKHKSTGIAKITISSKSYSVSRYSSYLATSFIDNKNFDVEYSVKFKGQIKDPEIILEDIQDAN